VHLTSSPIDWYAARAGGIVAYVLLSANVALGLAMTGKKSMKRWPRFALEDVHRFTGLLTGTFVVLHILTVAIDAYLPFSIVSLAVPLVAAYRPVWTGLGIVAAELLLALAITNHYRETKLTYAFWRKAHYVNFAVWAAATLHGIGSGTDRSTPWMVAIFAVAVGSVCGLIVWRVLRRSSTVTAWTRRPAPVLAAVAGVAVVATLGRGPLRFQPKAWNAATFRDALSGKILTDVGVTRGIVSMSGNGTGSQRVLVRADLLLTTTSLASTSFQMEYLPSGTLCVGTVSNVKSSSFDATCSMPDGRTRLISASWAVPHNQEGTFDGGVITSRPGPSDVRAAGG
jgi:methionine sulfoxide reductase heme-binding subunit